MHKSRGRVVEGWCQGTFGQCQSRRQINVGHCQDSPSCSINLVIALSQGQVMKGEASCSCTCQGVVVKQLERGTQKCWEQGPRVPLDCKRSAARARCHALVVSLQTLRKQFVGHQWSKDLKCLREIKSKHLVQASWLHFPTKEGVGSQPF